MISHSHGRIGVARHRALASALALAGCLLSGCSSPAASSSPTPFPTVPTIAVAPTPTPAASAAPLAADAPIDDLAAWAICKGLGDGGNRSVHVITRVYEPENITATGDGFTVQLIGEVGARSSSDSWCEVSGTLGDPQATFHLLQAEPVDAVPSAAFAADETDTGERTASTPIDALTAWAVCKGFERGLPLDLEGDTGVATNDYDPSFVVNSNGSFTVYILGSAAATEQTATCTISGPLGDPAAEYLLPR